MADDAKYTRARAQSRYYLRNRDRLLAKAKARYYERRLQEQSTEPEAQNEPIGESPESTPESKPAKSLITKWIQRLSGKSE